MNTTQRKDLLNIRKVLETSKSCIAAIVSVVDDNVTKIKILSDLEQTNNAILTIDKLLTAYKN